MPNNTYNGWTNRETWLVNVWFNPECAGDVLWAQEQVEEEYEKLPPFMRDFINLDAINWLELQEHFEDEEESEGE